MSGHALLSPSGAHRWIACPPSARWEEKIRAAEGETSSDSADEGTLAHALAELKLKHFLKQVDDDAYAVALKAIKEVTYYDSDMNNYTDEYVTRVKEKYAEAVERDEGAAMELEQKLDFSQYVPGGFGRSDVVIIADGTMEIIDFKYGKNVAVSALSNPQLRLYALGALKENSWLYKIDDVRMTIIQPRNGGESSDKLMVSELKAWAGSLRDIVKDAYNGTGEYRAGEHCKFCLAAPKCRALAKERTDLVARYSDYEPGELNDHEIVALMAKADKLVSYVNTLKAYTLKEALAGKKWKGFKLVAGRSSTKYKDEDAIAQKLQANGYSPSDFLTTPELIGITAMKKLLSTKGFNELLGDLTTKSPGKPTLVTVDDKRPELDLADGFEDLTD